MHKVKIYVDIFVDSPYNSLNEIGVKVDCEFDNGKSVLDRATWNAF